MTSSGRPLPILPGQYQPPLPLDRFILAEPPDAEHVPMDVVFVGAGRPGSPARSSWRAWPKRTRRPADR